MSRQNAHTPGPWVPNKHSEATVMGGPDGGRAVASCGGYSDNRLEDSGSSENLANARLVAAAPDLLKEARLLRCLVSSSRFQQMTVASALAELEVNTGFSHDNGAAISKAEGK